MCMLVLCLRRMKQISDQYILFYLCINYLLYTFFIFLLHWFLWTTGNFTQLDATMFCLQSDLFLLSHLWTPYFVLAENSIVILLLIFLLDLFVVILSLQNSSLYFFLWYLIFLKNRICCNNSTFVSFQQSPRFAAIRYIWSYHSLSLSFRRFRSFPGMCS